MRKVHVVPCNDGWAVKFEGDHRLISVHATQGDAVAAGKLVAKSYRTELVIHRLNGQIREAWSYGNDPYPPRG